MKPLFHLSKSEALLLALVVLLALAPRLTYVWQLPGELFSDMADYDQIARSLLRGEGFSNHGKVTAYRPPVYPLFLAAVYVLSQGSVVAVRVVQAFLGAASCGLMLLLGRHFFAHSRALSLEKEGPDFVKISAVACALIVVFFDEWIFYTGQLLGETLFVFLLLLWLLVLIHWHEKTQQQGRENYRTFFAGGVLAALLTLCRPSSLFLILAGVGFLMWKVRDTLPGRRRLKLLGVFWAGWLSLCLPWVARNWFHFGPWAGLSTNTGVNFYIGHNPYFSYWSTGDKEGIRSRVSLDEAQESRLFFRLGLAYALQHPVATLENMLKKFWYLLFEPWRPYPQKLEWTTGAGSSQVQRFSDPWNPWSWRHVGPYKPWPWFGHGLELPPPGGFPFPLLAWDVPLAALVLVGFVLALRDRCPWGFLYATMGGHIAAHLLFFAQARFRMPLGIVFALLAGYALTRGAQLSYRLCGKWFQGT